MPMKQNYSTFAKRLKYIIGDDSLLSFSKKCGLSESAIRKYIREESEPTLQNLLMMADVGNVSVAWLATGNDPFLSNTNLLPKDTKNIVVTIPEVHFDSLVDVYKQEIDHLAKKENILTEWVFSRDWLSRSGLIDSELAIVQIPYNNMANTIKTGDMAIISLAENDLNLIFSGVYIILLNEKLLIKRVQYDPVENGYHLINDNPIYKNHLIKQDGAVPFNIIAKIEHILTNVAD